MSLKSLIYTTLRTNQFSIPTYSCLLLKLSNEWGFRKFMDHCKDIAFTIVKEGSSVPVTSSTLKVRASLELPLIKFDNIDIKELARITGLLKMLGEFK